MYCIKCGKSNIPNAAFCEGCGAPMEPQEAPPGSWQGYQPTTQPSYKPMYQQTTQPIYTEGGPMNQGASGYDGEYSNVGFDWSKVLNMGVAGRGIVVIAAIVLDIIAIFYFVMNMYDLTFVYPILTSILLGAAGVFFISGFRTRNTALCIVFSLISAFTFIPIWMYLVSRDLKLLNRGDNSYPIADALLCAFIPFYCGYWAFTKGRKLYQTACRYGVYSSDNSVLYLILSLLFLNVITLAVMQGTLNSITTEGQEGRGMVNIPQNSAAAPTAPQVDAFDNIRKLAQLRDEGIISAEEFETAKANMLSHI